MQQKKVWLGDIIASFESLGGHGFYKDIYKYIADKNNSELLNDHKWTALIRATIERYSSDSEVWNGKTDLFYSVDGIRKGHWGLRNFILTNHNINESDVFFPEGEKSLRIHLVYERDHKLIKKAKEVFLKKNNNLYCEICGFDFEKKYGDIGKGYIEGHHLIPVSQIPPGYHSKIEDICFVCSNCHKMIHRKRPWLSKNQINKLLIKPPK